MSKSCDNASKELVGNFRAWVNLHVSNKMCANFVVDMIHSCFGRCAGLSVMLLALGFNCDVSPK